MTRLPQLSSAHTSLLDDYNDYGGCRRATDEILAVRDDLEIIATAPKFIFRPR